MTTTVKRGAGRPAAAEKSNRHSQRTPLPPKSGQVQAAKDAIEETRQAPQFGQMTVTQLRAYAREHGASSITKLTNKGELLTALLAWDQKQSAKVRQQTQPDPLDAKLDKSFGPVSTDSNVKQYKVTGAPQKAKAPRTATEALGSGKSAAKAQAFLTDAAGLGWDGAATRSGDTVDVTVRRGEESLSIQWHDGVFTGECFYAHNGRTPIKVHNASAARKRMAMQPAEAAAEARKVAAHKVARAATSTRRTATPSQLPFTEASMDQEVLDALYGRKIKWTNRVSGAEEEDIVPDVASGVRLADGSRGVSKQQHKPRITESKSGRMVEFVGAMGFRSVLLSQVTEVR